ncbi:hypothetical protein AK812_SmicGene29726 [Symbiodinium microadriaticum]|uniref:Reverse transcriptase domain-containing protein n=1 Tax=Symbiodinium microadriaticum TaxID=2951 RepID=A0A1Q9D111_SYMMI|nr:hypothetical protein AK812_SmicGene29726 [Symbiodinium microadriaticum]
MAALRDANVPENLVQAILLLHEEAKLKITHCGQEKIIPLRCGRDLEKAYAAIKHILESLTKLGLSISADKTVIILELKGPQAAKALDRYTVQTKEGRCMRFRIAQRHMYIKLVSKHIYLGAVISYKSFEHETFLHRLRLAKGTFTRLHLAHRPPWPGLCETLHTQLIIQARKIANSLSMITRESNTQFLDRHRLPDPVRRLQTSIAHCSDNDAHLGPELQPSADLLSWREIVRGQLTDPDASKWSQLPPNPGSSLLYLGDASQPSFDCDICGQSFYTQALIDNPEVLNAAKNSSWQDLAELECVTVPLELKEATQDLNMLRALLPQLETQTQDQDEERVTDPSLEPNRRPKWPKSHPKGHGKQGDGAKHQRLQVATETYEGHPGHGCLEKQLAEMKSTLGMPTTLVIRQEIQQGISKQDTSFVLFLDTRGPHNLATSLYKMGETWHATKRDHPDRLTAPTRVILFQHLLEAVLNKFKAMTETPSARSTAQNLGLLLKNGTAVPALKWDQTTRQHIQDTSLEPMETKDVKDALEELIVLSTKFLVITRFHGMRKLTEEYASQTLGMFLEIGVRTPEAHAAWNHLHRLQQSAAWQAAGVFLRHERLHMSSLANEWRHFQKQHDAAEFLQFLCGKTLINRPGIELSWRARCQEGTRHPGQVTDSGSSAPLLLPSPGEISEDSVVGASVQGLINKWHEQERTHAMFVPSEVLMLQLCRFHFETDGVRAVKRRYKVKPDRVITVPLFVDNLRCHSCPDRLNSYIIHLGEAPDHGVYHGERVADSSSGEYLNMLDDTEEDMEDMPEACMERGTMGRAARVIRDRLGQIVREPVGPPPIVLEPEETDDGEGGEPSDHQEEDEPVDPAGALPAERDPVYRHFSLAVANAVCEVMRRQGNAQPEFHILCTPPFDWQTSRGFKLMAVPLTEQMMQHPNTIRCADGRAEPKAKKSKPMVVADDPTPAEMKAIIQRMLNLVKYKADPLKNKSGDRLTEAQEVLEAYRQISDSDRKGFIAGYQKHVLKDLKWMGQYTKKVVKEAEEEDHSKGMMTSSRIFELNGLKFGDFPEKKQKKLLEGFLQECASTFEMTASLAAKDMEKLSSECIALENSKFAFKAPEIRAGLETLKNFEEDFRKTQVLLDRALSTMDEAACKAEKADVDQWNRNAREHLDNVKLLLKKVKGWLV